MIVGSVVFGLNVVGFGSIVVGSIEVIHSCWIRFCLMCCRWI